MGAGKVHLSSDWGFAGALGAGSRVLRQSWAASLLVEHVLGLSSETSTLLKLPAISKIPGMQSGPCFYYLFPPNFISTYMFAVCKEYSTGSWYIHIIYLNSFLSSPFLSAHLLVPLPFCLVSLLTIFPSFIYTLFLI